MAASFTIAEIERFLIDEAALLDEWRLEQWLALFAEDGRYLVPSLDQPDSDHRTALFHPNRPLEPGCDRSRREGPKYGKELEQGLLFARVVWKT